MMEEMRTEFNSYVNEVLAKRLAEEEEKRRKEEELKN